MKTIRPERSARARATQHAGLQVKLVRVFALQLLVISVTTLLAVYATAEVMERWLIREALDGEAAHYWARYDRDPSSAVPDTMNLLGYLGGTDGDSVPQSLKRLEPGYRRIAFEGRHPIVHISDHNGKRLYLIFDEEKVSDLAFYFGIFPLAGVLLTLYLMAWLSYRISKRAISPTVALAQRMEAFDVDRDPLSTLDLTAFRTNADAEVISLIDSLEHFTCRLEAFIDRERRLTADVSHELRTPLAVIRSSLELLQEGKPGDLMKEQLMERIERTVADMETITETLLVLARESDSILSGEAIVLNDWVREYLEQYRHVFESDRVRLHLEESCLLEIVIPEKILLMLFNNLLKNACDYSPQGTVSIHIDEGSLSVIDSGIGMTTDELEKAFKPFYRADALRRAGHGLGLAIISRLCSHYHWSIEADSTPGEGTRITVRFSDYRCVGKESDQSSA